MRPSRWLIMLVVSAAGCDSVAPREVNLCGAWQIRGDAAWDTVTGQISEKQLPAVVTMATLSGQDVLTLTRGELLALSGTAALGCASAPAAADPILIHGTVSGVPANKRFVVKSAGNTVTGTTTLAFDLQSRTGPVDVLAYVSSSPPTPSQTFQLPEKLIFRRGVELTDGANMLVLDFAGSEPFTLAAAALTGNLQRPVTSETIRFVSGTNTIDMRSNTTLSSTLVGVPESALRPGDYHLLTLGGGGNATTRFYYRTVAPWTVTLGPAGLSGVASMVTTAPCVRIRVIIPKQADYDSLASARIAWSGAGAGSITMTVTRAAMGSGDYWAVEVPDLGSACVVPSGRTLGYSATVARGRLAVYRGVVGNDGESLFSAPSGIFPP